MFTNCAIGTPIQASKESLKLSLFEPKIPKGLALAFAAKKQGAPSADMIALLLQILPSKSFFETTDFAPTFQMLFGYADLENKG